MKLSSIVQNYVYETRSDRFICGPHWIPQIFRWDLFREKGWGIQAEWNRKGKETHLKSV